MISRKRQLVTLATFGCFLLVVHQLQGVTTTRGTPRPPINAHNTAQEGAPAQDLEDEVMKEVLAEWAENHPDRAERGLRPEWKVKHPTYSIKLLKILH